MDASEAVDLFMFVVLSPLVITVFRRVRIPAAGVFLTAYALMFGFYVCTVVEDYPGLAAVHVIERAFLAGAGAVFAYGFWQLGKVLRAPRTEMG
jgi:hypothetical protein